MGKTLVVYYSFSGMSKVMAEQYAKKTSEPVLEIKDKKKPSAAKAYTSGVFFSVKGKAWPIQPIETDLKKYSSFVLFFPIWAGNAPPSVNAFFELLPENKSVSIKALSSIGHSKCRDRIEAVLKQKKCSLDGYTDIKTGGKAENF